MINVGDNKVEVQCLKYLVCDIKDGWFLCIVLGIGDINFLEDFFSRLVKRKWFMLRINNFNNKGRYWFVCLERFRVMGI